jgi:hypothetical protein
MKTQILNIKTVSGLLVALFLCFLTIRVLYPELFGSQMAEKAVSCDSGAYFKLNDVHVNIPAEYMQGVYAGASQKPVHGGNTYTCSDVTENKPLQVSHIRFFPEAFLNKNILIDDTPYKTITPLQIRPVPKRDGAAAAAFSCNDQGQCAAVVIKDDVLFMIELSEMYFGSSLQKDIFYASFQRFIADLLPTPHAPAAE